MKYNKLVRDKIPEIIKHNGDTPEVRMASDEEYFAKLKEKLVEEALEFQKDGNPEELADVQEIIYAICEAQKMDMSVLEMIRKEKLEKRGGFTKRIILEETKEK